ncbi:MAG TPA: hypothetical protein VG326_06600 [Tepidisphaeraceae bacterium]|jgi:hypothetical protein|nr:hypothetical protein [Tepidisphaeraceae bacterium]
MKHLSLIPFLLLAALFSVGCTYDAATISAEAPGGTHGQCKAIDAPGTYALFHVTQFDMWGAPVTTEKLITLNLKDKDHLGFEYIIPKDQQYNGDAKSEVVAYAGSFKRNLGPITSINEKYYWADPNDWDGYWKSRPERVLAKRATMY